LAGGHGADFLRHALEVAENPLRFLVQARAFRRQLDLAPRAGEQARDSGGCEMCSAAAARPKCSCSATATK